MILFTESQENKLLLYIQTFHTEMHVASNICDPVNKAFFMAVSEQK